MNQAVNKQLELGLGKNLFIVVYLGNEPSASPNLESTIKWDKL